jgi:hypothetical protein
MKENAMREMLQSIADTFAAERKKEEPYKELFKAGSSLTGLLRELETQMMGPVLDACEVMKERLGTTVNTEQFYVLLALPLLIKIATKNAEQHEGSACCVDKAYFIMSEQLLALGTKEQSDHE